MWWCTEVRITPLQLLSSSSFSKPMDNSVRKSRLMLFTGGFWSFTTAIPAQTHTKNKNNNSWILFTSLDMNTFTHIIIFFVLFLTLSYEYISTFTLLLVYCFNYYTFYCLLLTFLLLLFLTLFLHSDIFLFYIKYLTLVFFILLCICFCLFILNVQKV